MRNAVIAREGGASKSECHYASPSDARPTSQGSDGSWNWPHGGVSPAPLSRSPNGAHRTVGPQSSAPPDRRAHRSEEHTSELQSLMRISYAVFCLKKKNKHKHQTRIQLYNND